MQEQTDFELELGKRIASLEQERTNLRETIGKLKQEKSELKSMNIELAKRLVCPVCEAMGRDSTGKICLCGGSGRIQDAFSTQTNDILNLRAQIVDLKNQGPTVIGPHRKPVEEGIEAKPVPEGPPRWQISPGSKQWFQDIFQVKTRKELFLADTERDCRLADAARNFARIVWIEAPSCADRSEALRCIRTALFWAREAIDLAGLV